MERTLWLFGDSPEKSQSLDHGWTIGIQLDLASMYDNCIEVEIDYIQDNDASAPDNGKRM